MKRGEIWTLSGGPGYAGKPRPAVILQDDAFAESDSVTVCALTTDPTPAPLFRLPVEPGASNDLRSASSLMVGKTTSVPRSKLGERLGRLGDEQQLKLNRSVFVFLGLGPQSRRS